jgi:hypothetical protein
VAARKVVLGRDLGGCFPFRFSEKISWICDLRSLVSLGSVTLVFCKGWEMGEAIWIGMGGSNGVLLSVYNYMGMGKRCLGFSVSSDKLGVWEFVSFVHDRRKIKRVWAYIHGFCLAL